MDTNEVEIEEENLENALDKGLEKLGLKSRKDIEYKILSKEEGKVKVRIREKASGNVGLVKKEVETFLDKLKAKGTVHVEKEDDRLYVNITTEKMDGLLIGKSGRNLESVQHLLSRIIHNKDTSIELTIDVSSYRRKKEHTLRVRSKAFAQEVKRSGREFIFEPLPPSLRRTVHLAVSDIEGVRTYTIGEEDLKKVVISPAKK